MEVFVPQHYNSSMQTVSKGFDILGRVIDPDEEPMPAEVARFVQQWKFSVEDHARYEELSLKAQEGTLSEDEREILEGYLQVDSLVSGLKIKAKRSLRA